MPPTLFWVAYFCHPNLYRLKKTFLVLSQGFDRPDLRIFYSGGLLSSVAQKYAFNPKRDWIAFLSLSVDNRPIMSVKREINKRKNPKKRKSKREPNLNDFWIYKREYTVNINKCKKISWSAIASDSDMFTFYDQSNYEQLINILSCDRLNFVHWPITRICRLMVAVGYCWFCILDCFMQLIKTRVGCWLVVECSIACILYIFFFIISVQRMQAEFYSTFHKL